MTSDKDKLSNLLADVRALREDYSDEIPEKIVTGPTPEGKKPFKVQKNWMNTLNSTMMVAINKGLVSPDIKDEYMRFEGYQQQTHLWDRHSTPEDIRRGNQLLDHVIGYCEKKLKDNP